MSSYIGDLKKGASYIFGLDLWTKRETSISGSDDLKLMTAKISNPVWSDASHDEKELP